MATLTRVKVKHAMKYSGVAGHAERHYNNT